MVLRCAGESWCELVPERDHPTVSVPVMLGWMAQKNSYEPGAAGAVNDLVPPRSIEPVSKPPSRAVAVCGTESRLITVTVAPGAT
jgi:hypothetical protein